MTPAQRALDLFNQGEQTPEAMSEILEQTGAKASLVALELYDQQPDGEKDIAAAAAMAGVKAPTLHVTIKRRAEKLAAGREPCPCCGQVVREGYAIDRSVLRKGA